MAERDYSHRDVVDKLGVKPGHVVAFAEHAGELDRDLRERVLTRAGGVVTERDSADLALVTVDDSSDAVAILRQWKARLTPAGGVWLLSPKRGQSGYVDQRKLIAAGLAAGLVDNKVCSLSETTSAIRFVIRKTDRAAHGAGAR